MGEPGTLMWHAAKIEGENGVCRVFDTFDDEAAREARLNGEAGREFVEKAGELFTEATINRLQVVAQK
jgi:quinol monooxygenase YgiN